MFACSSCFGSVCRGAALVLLLGMQSWLVILLCCLCIAGCKQSESEDLPVTGVCAIRAADISFLPQLEAKGVLLYNATGQAESMLTTLKNAGCNVVRLRLWYAPSDGHSGLAEVKTLVARAKTMGFKIWLTVHYSDSWADPATQTMPLAWSSCSFDALQDSVYNYTLRIMTQMQPDFIQIGNEINNGFLWPIGKSDKQSQFTALLDRGIKAVRAANSATKIILHCAGTNTASWLFSLFTQLDYDMIGISYYPVWHGKDLVSLQTTLQNLAASFGKSVVIAETAYPFTLDWNDLMNNIVGSESQLIDGYPATPVGQHDFLAKIRDISCSFPNGLGFCYWGGDYIAWKGKAATDGSSWENQALYDFNNKALPVIGVYSGK